MRQYFGIFCFLITILTFTSCVKEKDFPIVPSIVFKQYNEYSRDSADCIITFKDGDGDIALTSEDTLIADNFRLKYLYKDMVTGVFKPFDANQSTPAMDTLFYSYRVPVFPLGQFKAIEGEIKAKLRSAPLYHPNHKVVKFEITLTDRAGHVSNMVSSNEIILP